MRPILTAFAAIALLAAPSASAISFDFEDTGTIAVTDCVTPAVPPPACLVLDGLATANDVPDIIPGIWQWSAHGQVLFGVGTGTEDFLDPSPANNSFSTTWTNVVGLPDPLTGIARADFQYLVVASHGLFAGNTGTGTSVVDVVVAPFAFTPEGVPQFGPACEGGPAGFGAFCERGSFLIPEPGARPLAIVALAIAWLAAGNRARRRWRPR
jgi:hypothetical protein